MSQTILITGANRGIGLEMAHQWHARGETVIAVVRQSSDALNALGVRVIDGIDVGTEAHMPRLREALDDISLDVLFNNAGVLSDESLDDLDMDCIRDQFEINTLGPLRVTAALRGLFARGAKVGLMTSRMGSIADNDSGGRYGYRISKAGLNAAGKSLAVDLRPEGVAVAILHPGYVRTDMTGGRGQIEAHEAAARLIERMDELTLENSGTFWHSDGSVLPW